VEKGKTCSQTSVLNRECQRKASLVESMTRTLFCEGKHKLQPVFEFFVISTLRIIECFAFFSLRQVVD
jgi:hypothetical protein